MLESADTDSIAYRRLKVVSTVLSVPLSGTAHATNYLKNCAWNLLLGERCEGIQKN